MPAITAREQRDFVTIGVNGAGTEGLSLLLHCLVLGHVVVLRVEDKAALGEALGQVVQLLFAEVQRGAMAAAAMQKLQGSVRGTFTWTHFDQIDLLLDTLAGSLGEKQKFYRVLESHIPTAP